MVRLALPSSTHASVVVYNAAGMKVGVLWNGRLPAGQHRFDWSAEAHAGRAVGPGVYYIRATAGQWTRVTSVRVVR
jgi:flagellar hook assembly protein FlgD